MDRIIKRASILLLCVVVSLGAFLFASCAKTPPKEDDTPITTPLPEDPDPLPDIPSAPSDDEEEDEGANKDANGPFIS